MMRSGSKNIVNRKVRSIREIISLYKNWPKYLIIGKLKLSLGERIISLRNGMRIKVRPQFKNDLGIINEIVRYGVYPLYEDQLADDPVIIDIGAHIGVFSILAAHCLRTSVVYSYEPYSKNFRLLRENIALNEVADRVKPFNLAVWGEKVDSLRLRVSRTNTGRNSVIFDGNVPHQESIEEVGAISVPEIFESNRINIVDLLKLDCEGAEFNIILGIPEDYLRRIRIIQMEYHYFGSTDQRDLRNLQQHLIERDFKVEIEKKKNGRTGYLRGINTNMVN